MPIAPQLLVLTGSNNLTGPTIISSGGTLQFGNGTTNGYVGGTAITDSGVLAFATSSASSRPKRRDQRHRP